MKKKKVCFAASSGGHFEQIMMLKKLMNTYDSFLLTEKTNYNIELNKKVYYLLQVNRKEVLFIFKFFIDFCKTIYIFLKEKPDIVISTGALSTIPICVISKIFGKKIIFIESFAKINSPTLTGRFVYKFSDLFIIQWESLKRFYPNAIVGGSIY